MSIRKMSKDEFLENLQKRFDVLKTEEENLYEKGISLRMPSYAEIFYSAFTEEVFENIKNRVSIVLPDFGTFYFQNHKGHPVPSKPESPRSKPYPLAKFSASLPYNRRLREEITGDNSVDFPVKDNKKEK